MSLKNWKRGLRRKRSDHMTENYKNLSWGKKFMGWDWKRRGSWKNEPPKRHPGWAAYHANKEKE
jgi:hypothetical protein